MELEIQTRVLTMQDAMALRSIRLEALNNEGRFYTANRTAEMARTAHDWQAAVQETRERAFFGAFMRKDLVGIMEIVKSSGDPLGRTARFCSAYLKPLYRHTGAAAELYKAREIWAEEHGYREAVCTIHHENYLSAHLHIKNGAQQFASELLPFADGSLASAIWYCKQLKVSQLATAA